MQTRTALAVILVTSLGLALPMPATSEPIRKRNDPAAVIAQVTPGAQVRIEDTKGRVWEGRYIAITDGAVVLDDPLARIPSASIRQVWIRGRATRSGAIIGGVLFGLSKAARAAIGAGFQCEDCQGAVRAASARGFGIGAGIGALAGGLVGAAFPKWHRLDLDRPTRTRTGGGTHDAIGAFSLQGGGARGRDPNSGKGGLGGRLGLAARLPGGLAPGVEFGRFGLGRGTVVTPRGRTLNFTESVTHFGFSFTKARDHGRLRPYGLVSIGHYSWKGVNASTLNPDFEIVNPEIHQSFLGASLGGGVRWRARRRLAFETEGRWHTSLHEVARSTFDGPAQHWRMVSLTAGARLLW